MLEKNEKKFCDSHLHVVNVPDFINELQKLDFSYSACSVALSIKEWNDQTSISLPDNVQLYHCFGMHPQSAADINIEENIFFLEKLLQEEKENAKQLSAIGEIGFDYFTKEFLAAADIQEKIFNMQLDLAIQYKKPVIIHCRKANEKLFEYAPQLKKLPAVLFHSFMGTVTEAQSLQKRGINAYFSFGKQIFNNNKKVIECVKGLEADCLLPETDAPYQKLKGEEYTHIKEIAMVYEGMAKLKNIPMAEIQSIMNKNFNTFIKGEV